MKNPAYRIYISHNDNKVFDKLVENIMAHKTVFTLSLGLSELLADFRFISVKEFIRREKGQVEITTVIPMNMIEDYGVNFEQGKKYFKEKLRLK